MGKFSELVAKSMKQKKLEDKAARAKINKLIDEVSRIFMDQTKFKSLLQITHATWEFVLKDEKDMEKYKSLMEKTNLKCILFESGQMYKNKDIYGSRTFTIESPTETDIDLIFEHIKVAFEKLKLNYD